MWIVALSSSPASRPSSPGVNIITTVANIYLSRARHDDVPRVPIFTWNMVVTGILILVAVAPVLTAALIMLLVPATATHRGRISTPRLWRWGASALAEPVLVLWASRGLHPRSAVLRHRHHCRIIPVFSRKPLFGYKGMIFATISIAALSTAVWAHHMFTTGVVLLPFFSLMSYLIAVPTGIKFFNWIGTMWRGSITFDTPMLFAVGFLIVFLFGGVTGIFLASPPIDFATHDTYFVVAHFHEVLFGSAVVAVGSRRIYFWYPKITGRMLRSSLGKVSFWFMFIGFWVTFLPQYLAGLHGMPRRIAEYSAASGWTGLNRISTAGAYLLFTSVAIMVWNFWVSWRKPEPASANPWDAGALEWATSSPPPHHNFYSIPPIRSERPVWDFNHPEHLAIAEHGAAGPGATEHGAVDTEHVR